MASNEETFAPYKPPIVLKMEQAGGGPETPASSLLWRLGTQEVTPEVIAVVAWALSFMVSRHPKQRDRADGRSQFEQDLLDELGLEWALSPMGAAFLQPKAEYLSRK